jgi:hypothetical protein
MRNVFLPALAAGLLLSVLPACSSSNGGTGGSSTGGSATCPGDLAEAPPTPPFCADSPSPTDCMLVNGSYHNRSAGCR